MLILILDSTFLYVIFLPKLLLKLSCLIHGHRVHTFLLTKDLTSQAKKCSSGSRLMELTDLTPLPTHHFEAAGVIESWNDLLKTTVTGPIWC